MAKYLVTGGSGFIGTNLIEKLLIGGNDILSIDKTEPKISAHSSMFKKVDILDYLELEKAILTFNPEYVIHLGARTDLNGKTLEEYDANIEGVKNLLLVLDKIPCLKRVLFTSSMYVCEPGYTPKDFDDYKPHTIYGESKVMTEKIIKEKNPSYEWAIIRPTSIWGPYFGEPYDLFFKIVISRKYLHMGTKACKKTYGYIDNFVYQLDSLLKTPIQNINKKVFYLGDYEPYDITEWANEIASERGIKIPNVPFFVFQGLAFIGDVLGYAKIKFPMTSFRLKNMTTNNIFDLSSIEEIAPNLPIERKVGVAKTVEWLSEKL